MIDQTEIDSIKQGVDLVLFMQTCGIELKQVGSNYRGFCPFHEDTTPSLTVNPKENLWNCFGCDKGGDNIRFVQLFDNLSFAKAVERLKGYFPGSELPKNTNKRKKAVKKKTDECKTISPAHIKVLSRVIDFYHTAFCEDTKGREYLETRGITDTKLFADHKIGLSSGTLLNVLPGEGDIKEQLQELGILNDKGKEHFYGCITFPLYDPGGNPAGIYGRRVTGKGADHLYLPGPRLGIFNRQAAKGHKEIILTEAVIDAVTLIDTGITNTIPCYGTNGLTADHISLFKQQGTQKIYLCFDNDDAGLRGQEAVTARLQDEAIRFLKNPDLLEEIVEDLETVGYTGEEMNKLLCYIAAVSRKTDDPLSVMIQSAPLPASPVCRMLFSLLSLMKTLSNTPGSPIRPCFIKTTPLLTRSWPSRSWTA